MNCGGYVALLSLGSLGGGFWSGPGGSLVISPDGSLVLVLAMVFLLAGLSPLHEAFRYKWSDDPLKIVVR